MSAREFLDRLRRLDIRVWVDGDALRCNAPASALSPDLRGELAQRKAELLDFLRSAAALSRQQAAIVPLQADGTRCPIFCFGGHKGDVFAYRQLAQAMGRDQPFFGLQPPGLDGQEPPFARFEDLGVYFADQLATFYPRGPLILAGYCLGGSIMAELARQLRERDGDQRVALLALFGSPYPAWFGPTTQWRLKIGDQWRRLKRHWEVLGQRGWRDRWRYPQELRARRRQRRDSERLQADDPATAARQRVADAHAAAVLRYRPQPYAGRAALFMPNAGWLRSDSPAADWLGVFRQVEQYVGPADCESTNMLREPFVDVFAELFRRSAAAATAASSTPPTIEKRPERRLRLRTNPSLP